ncbi:MAG: DoxX family protein [Gemmatimonadota bacterium]|nr:DoxX family protein [Gemmatimonadota bacterium]
MTLFAIAAQVVIALGIFNVWILRRNRATPYRPDGAADLEDEFRRYGLPDWVRSAVGITKVGLAVLLIIGVVFSPIAAPSAAVMAVLMVAAIAAHVKVGDPVKRSAPALLMLLLSVIVVVGQT